VAAGSRVSGDTAAGPATLGGEGPLAIGVAAATTQAVGDAAPADLAEVFPMLALDPYASKERVSYFLKLFSGDSKAHMGERLSAGTRYGSMIREKLRAAGIPEEFLFLALIESGFDPHAYSSAAAVGLWQFMTGTARGIGLRVDWWIDERRDPPRATDAAIRYLTDLRGQFGSMYLAAAAYNSGSGTVSRGLSHLAQSLVGTEPDDKYFALASTNLLRAETKNYVPQLIAAALIGREPLTYGIKVDTQPRFVFDSVVVPQATSLHSVAMACGIGVSDVLDLNGQVLRGMTPPDGPDVWLRVPPACAPTFSESFAALDSAERIGAAVHATKKGESFASIAAKAGISVTALRRYNPRTKVASATVLPAGQKVLVPTAATVAAARDVPDPSIERYGVAVGGVYEVRRGDTLGQIAERNHTTVASLKRINKLKSDIIQIGQKIRVR
jgi:membrane-bound lytic murein transglycosylase D